MSRLTKITIPPFFKLTSKDDPQKVSSYYFILNSVGTITEMTVRLSDPEMDEGTMLEDYLECLTIQIGGCTVETIPVEYIQNIETFWTRLNPSEQDKLGGAPGKFPEYRKLIKQIGSNLEVDISPFFFLCGSNIPTEAIKSEMRLEVKLKRSARCHLLLKSHKRKQTITTTGDILINRITPCYKTYEYDPDLCPSVAHGTYLRVAHTGIHQSVGGFIKSDQKLDNVSFLSKGVHRKTQLEAKDIQIGWNILRQNLDGKNKGLDYLQVCGRNDRTAKLEFIGFLGIVYRLKQDGSLQQTLDL